jgi:hypothetical protein
MTEQPLRIAPHAPFPKWVYDVVLELVHCHRHGTQVDPTAILPAVPLGMVNACQGILDYHGMTDGASAAPVPAAPDTPTVTTALPPVPAVAAPADSPAAQVPA